MTYMCNTAIIGHLIDGELQSDGGGVGWVRPLRKIFLTTRQPCSCVITLYIEMTFEGVNGCMYVYLAVVLLSIEICFIRLWET